MSLIFVKGSYFVIEFRVDPYKIIICWFIIFININFFPRRKEFGWYRHFVVQSRIGNNRSLIQNTNLLFLLRFISNSLRNKILIYFYRDFFFLYKGKNLDNWSLFCYRIENRERKIAQLMVERLDRMWELARILLVIGGAPYKILMTPRKIGKAPRALRSTETRLDKRCGETAPRTEEDRRMGIIEKECRVCVLTDLWPSSLSNFIFDLDSLSFFYLFFFSFLRIFLDSTPRLILFSFMQIL